MAEQQEDLEFRDSDLIESQALIPPARGNGADDPGPAPGDDISNLSDREIWRHFESTKESAIHHLGRYLHHRKAWQQLQPAGSSPPLDLGRQMGQQEQPPAETPSANALPPVPPVPQNTSSMPREFWDLKVSRDNLLSELDFLHRLLDLMYPAANKGLATYYCLVACLFVALSPLLTRNQQQSCQRMLHLPPRLTTWPFRAVVVGATWSSTQTVVKAIWGIGTVALSAATGVTALRTGRRFSAQRCIAMVWGLHQKVQNDSLNEADKHSLETSAFQTLWWTSYLLTKRPPGEEY